MNATNPTALPEADAENHRYFIEWLGEFSSYVRDVDYASAMPLFHPDVLAFGTHNDVVKGLDSWVSTQWDNVWPKTRDFSFNLDTVRVLVATDNSMATVIAPWTSTGYDLNGNPFDRPGRATLIFSKVDARWVCTHSHMSLNRGVPQESHADRPVKRR